MAIKAAFFDIDGTLVSFKTHGIPQSTIDAIAKAKANGVKIYISTGRPVAIINNIGAIEHLIDGYITFNGAYCFVGDEDIAVKSIPKKDVLTMIEDASKRNYSVIVCGKKDIAIHNYREIFTKIFVEDLGVTNIDIRKPIDSLLESQILQLTPFFSSESEARIMPDMPHCVSARWHPDFTDITVKGADKGNALRTMAAHLGYEIGECIAFGDGGNDVSILQSAGIGVAMGNASEEVKAKADYITTSVDEDGIRNALQHFGVID